MDTQKKLEAATLDFAATIRNVFVFIALSGLMWWISNSFSVSQPEGFDPLRYEYLARIGLPPQYYNSSSYRIVLILEFIYRYLPYYIGYLLFIGILCFFIRYFDTTRVISYSIFSPVAFYFLGQTGKDGIAIIAMISVALISASKNSYKSYIFCIIIVGLSFYIRPAILLLVPIVFVQFRFGTIWATLAAVVLIYIFSTNFDTYEMLNSLESLTLDEGSGQSAQLLRAYTFGYTFEAVSVKMILLMGSFLFQPFLSLLKFYSGSSAFVLYEGACYLVFLYFIWKKKLLIKFMVACIPYVLILGSTTPFYHFRYLAIAYPIIFAYCQFSPGLGFKITRQPSVGSSVPRNQVFEMNAKELR
jgi:hypothetical protein